MSELIKVGSIFKEYFFARSINRVNEVRFEHNLPLITVTQGREMHKVFDDYMNEISPVKDLAGLWNGVLEGFNRSVTPYNAGQRVFRSNVLADEDSSKVFTTSEGDKGITVGKNRSREFVKSVVVDFQETTGLRLADSASIENFSTSASYNPQSESEPKPQVRSPYNRKGTNDKPLFIPISPYDPKFAMNNTILTHGTEILYAKASDVLGYRVVEKTRTAENDSNSTVEWRFNLVFKDGDARLYHYDPKDSHYNIMNRDNDAGPLYSDEDRYGLSRLRPYIDKNDYKKLVNVVSEWSKLRVAPQPMSSEALDKSVKILQYLREQGRPYSVTADTKPGQLIARIGNSKLQIRIMDDGKAEQYVGRTYNDGYTGFLMPMARDATYEPSWDVLKKVLDYTLGLPAERVGMREANSYIGTSHVKATTATDDTVLARNKSTDSYDFRTLFGYDKAHTWIKGKDGEKKHSEYTPRIMYRVQNAHSRSFTDFTDATEAEQYVRDAITTAYENFEKEMDLDRLIEEASLHKGEEEYVPVYSSNPLIEPVQRQYWEILTGARTNLYRNDIEDEEVADEELDAEYEEGADLGVDLLLNSLFKNEDTYEGTPEEKVRQHFADASKMMFGTFDKDDNGKRFNPIAVSTFMASGLGSFRNNDNLVAAMRTLGIEGDELLGDDFATNTMKDKLIRYDESSARVMRDIDTPFMKRVYQTIHDTLEQTGCHLNEDSIKIDKNGIVHYEGERVFEGRIKDSKKQSTEKVVGEIGQIFEPDEDRVVETKFGSGVNKLFTPGYLAYVLPNKDGENKPLEERTRYRGYENVLLDNLRMTLRSDMYDSHNVVGSPTSVNNTYRSLFVTRYKINVPRVEGESLKKLYFEQGKKTHLSEDFIRAQFKTNAGLIRFPTTMKDSCGLDRAYEEEQLMTEKTPMEAIYELTNDNVIDEFELIGRRNIGVFEESSDGYWDKMATGSAKNQGITRYAVSGSHFTEDGRLEPARNEDGTINKDARIELFKLKEFRYIDRIPFDRGQMVFSNAMSCFGVTEPVGFTQMTLCGLNFDDGVPIRKDFAEQYGLIGEDGEVRSLKIGDKVCSFAGNKGVISFVVDPDMTDEEIAESPHKEMLEQLVPIFRDNPELQVVLSPMSAPGRANASDGLMGIEKPIDEKSGEEKPKDLKVNGKVYEGSMGYMPFIVTDKTVEEKSKLYETNGRSASPMLNWLLSAKGMVNTMHELYGDNNSALENFREMMLLTGLDFDECGRLHEGYIPHEGEERNVFPLMSKDAFHQLLDKAQSEDKPDGHVKQVAKLAAQEFEHIIEKKGGFLEIPFQLDYPVTGKLEPVENPQSGYGVPMYKLPILSAHLRCGQEFIDGTRMTHDYTNHYVSIFENSLRYLDLLDENGSLNSASEQDKRKAALYRDKVKQSFDNISKDISDRIYEGKYNFIRSHLMAKKQPHSATAVMTPLPDLKINQIGMNETMMKELDVKEGDLVLVWRDPCLHTSSMVALEVKKDNDLYGVAVEPSVAKRFDGDYDGDAIAVVALKNKNSLKELEECISLEQNLLDRTCVRTGELDSSTNLQDGRAGDHPLFFNTDMDIVLAYHEDPQLQERLLKLEQRANDIDRDKSLSMSEVRKLNRELLLGNPDNPEQDSIDQVFHDAFLKHVGMGVISYKDKEKHLESLIELTKTGAKGSPKKIHEGYEVYLNDEQTREDIKSVQKAVQVKTAGTPQGGTISQRAEVVSRNVQVRVDLNEYEGSLQRYGHDVLSREDPKYADMSMDEFLKENKTVDINVAGFFYDLTYLVTQAALQSKHDAVQSNHLYHELRTSIANLFAGHKMESYEYNDMVSTGVKNAREEGRLKNQLKDGKLSEAEYNEQMASLHAEPPITQTSFRPVLSKDGKFIQMSADEWEQMFANVFDNVGLGDAYNKGFVKLVSKVLADEKNLIEDFQSEATQKRLGSIMDRLAYNTTKGSAGRYHAVAKECEGIYDGLYNQHLAPTFIRNNLKVKEHNANLAEGEERQSYRPICSNDVLVDSSQRVRLERDRKIHAQTNMEGAFAVKVGGKSLESLTEAKTVFEEKLDELRPERVAERMESETVEEVKSEAVVPSPEKVDISSAKETESTKAVVSGEAKVAHTSDKQYVGADEIDDLSDVVVEENKETSSLSMKLQEKAAAQQHEKNNGVDVIGVGAGLDDVEAGVPETGASSQRTRSGEQPG